MQLNIDEQKQSLWIKTYMIFINKGAKETTAEEKANNAVDFFEKRFVYKF